MEKNSRIIGKYGEDEGETLLLVTAGVHGNEPSGVKALQKVFAELEKSQPRFKGCFLGVSGNSQALQQGKRFIDEDLNRVWTDENLRKPSPDSNEQREMQDILELLKDYPKTNFKKRFFIDCHTTSSDSLPYISVQEVGENNQFAEKFPIYIVRGFSDIVNGSIDKYFSLHDLTGFTFEAGQHQAKSTQTNHEGIIWLALQAIFKLDLDNLSSYPKAVENLTRKAAPEQKIFQIIYRHGLEPDDVFKMERGFKNFQKIKKGELLAVQNEKEIRSEWDATIFMPLYQTQGNDGFFVIEEVKD